MSVESPPLKIGDTSASWGRDMHARDLYNSRPILFSILITVCNVWDTMSDATNSSARKRKRTKLKCFVPRCNETFDNDYPSSQSKKHHKGLLFTNKNVPYETPGDFKNPSLIAAKQRQTSQGGADFCFYVRYVVALKRP